MRDAAEPQVRIIRGRVIAAAEPPIPLRRARITVIAGGRSSEPAFADESGLFELAVPGTAYVIHVTKSGYAPVDAPGPPLAGEPITIAMPAAAALRIRVVDAIGQPGVGVSVRVRQIEPK